MIIFFFSLHSVETRRTRKVANMKKANTEIRDLLKLHGITQWEIADIIGINEWQLCRLLRKPLSDEMKGKVLSAIDKIKKGE